MVKEYFIFRQRLHALLYSHFTNYQSGSIFYYSFEGLKWIHRLITISFFMRGIKWLMVTLILLSGAVNAQSIKGKLLDLTDNKPLAGATVTLAKIKDSTKTIRTISGSNGPFEFKYVVADYFFLQITFTVY